MDVVEEDDRLLIRLDPGDRVMQSLERVQEEYDVGSGFFVGIGAVDRCTLGHYDVDEQDYKEKAFEGQFEVTNFTGNMTPDKIHAHITLGKRDFSTIGGHCGGARVSGTFEIVVVTGETKITHVLDETTGLDVFDI